MTENFIEIRKLYYLYISKFSLHFMYFNFKFPQNHMYKYGIIIILAHKNNLFEIKARMELLKLMAVG